MEEPPCAKSRERVVFFSPLLIAFNTRAGVISPPVPRGARSGRATPRPGPTLGVSKRRCPPTHTPLILTPCIELQGRNQRRGHGPHQGLSPASPRKKRVERVNEVNEENQQRLVKAPGSGRAGAPARKVSGNNYKDTPRISKRNWPLE